MAFQLLLLEFLLGGALLGALVAFRKSVGERVILFATVPLAYLLSYLLMHLGVFDFIGTAVLSALSDMEPLSEILGQSAATAGLIAGLINCIVRPLLLVPVFWLLLLVFRITYAIVAKSAKLREKAAFFRPVEKGSRASVWKNLGISAIGAVGGFVICMLSLFPISYYSGLLLPALETAEKEQYNGTYVQAQAEVIHTTLMPLAEHTVPGAMQTYTGLRFVMDATADGLGEVTVRDNNGNKIKFNGTEFVQTLAKDGASAAAIYEFTCHPSRHTFADLAPIADILSDLANNKTLTAVGSELLSGSIKIEEGGDGDVLSQLLSMLVGEYTSGDSGVLETDLHAISAMIALLADDLGNVSLQSDDLATELMNYLDDEESAYRVLDALSDFHVYGEVFGMLAEYGVDALADVLEVSEDRAAHHDSFMLALIENLNDRSRGTYNKEGVDAFIRFVAENDVKVSEYATAITNNAALMEAAHQNYERFIGHERELEEILSAYTDSAKGVSYYVSSDGTVYAYDKKTDKWAEAAADAVLSPVSYLAEQLLHKVDALLIENSDRVFTEADIVALGNEIVTSLSTAQEDYKVTTRTVALALTDENAASFAPGAVYREDIVGKLNTDVTFDEEKNRQFAKIVSTAAGLFGNLTNGEEGEDALAGMMDEFASIGRLLDGLASFEMTKDVPEQMLKAIMQNGDYGKYFDADSINTLIEKVKAGSATYESLFESVQALYGIINQVIPQ